MDVRWVKMEGGSCKGDGADTTADAAAGSHIMLLLLLLLLLVPLVPLVPFVPLVVLVVLLLPPPPLDELM